MDRTNKDTVVAPLVSVVIPTCNRAHLLTRAIQSVLSQTYSNLEIIVVDDASNDDTSSVVLGFKDSRIRYIRHETRQGGASARNTGINAGAGQFLAFLDDDDEWEAEKTELQLAALEGWDVVLCMSTSSSDEDVRSLVSKGRCSLDDLREGMPRIGTGASGIVGHAHVFRSVQFDPKLPRCQDWDLLIRVAERFRIRYLGRRLVRYNDAGHDRISNRMARQSISATELNKYLLFFEKHRAFFGERRFRRHLVNALMYGFRERRDKLSLLRRAVHLCGFAPVASAIAERALPARGFWRKRNA